MSLLPALPRLPGPHITNLAFRYLLGWAGRWPGSRERAGLEQRTLCSPAQRALGGQGETLWPCLAHSPCTGTAERLTTVPRPGCRARSRGRDSREAGAETGRLRPADGHLASVSGHSPAREHLRPLRSASCRASPGTGDAGGLASLLGGSGALPGAQGRLVKARAQASPRSSGVDICSWCPPSSRPRHHDGV